MQNIITEHLQKANESIEAVQGEPTDENLRN
jgi:hypothetical protein